MNTKTTIFSILGIFLFLGACAIIYYLTFYQNTIYYTQIDNNNIKKVESYDDFKYEYTLKSYKEDGKSKEIKFQTTRELKDKAYLKLKVMITRGVISWEEVSLEELPQKVKSTYNTAMD